MKNITDKIVSLRTPLLDAMKTMDTQKVKTLFVFDGEHFEGLLTLGDIQRAIIKNIALSETVSRILNKNKVYGYVTEGENAIKEKIRRMRAEVMPILDEKVNWWMCGFGATFSRKQSWSNANKSIYLWSSWLVAKARA